MAPSLDLVLVDPAGGADRPVTVPGEARLGRVADGLASRVRTDAGGGWGLRRAGEAANLPADRTLLEAGVRAGERIELVAPPPPPRAPSPPPREPPGRSRSLPPPQPHDPQRGRGAIVAAVLVAIVLLAGGGAFAATRLLGGSDPDPVALTPAEWAAEPEGAEPDAAEEATASGEEDSAEETAIPELTRDEMRAEIGDRLLAHHTAIVNEDYQEAWELLSNRKRRQYLSEGDGYPTWQENQSTLASYLDPWGLQVQILSLDRDEGVATVRVTGMGWSAPGSPCSKWSGITWVKHERSDWYYDPGYSTTPSRERAWKPRYEELLGGSC